MTDQHESVTRIITESDDVILVGSQALPRVIRADGIPVPGLDDVIVDLVATTDPRSYEYVLTDLRIHSPDNITGVMLRQILPQSLLKQVLRDHVRDWWSGAVPAVLRDPEVGRELGGYGPTAEALKAVALVYVFALVSGDAPAKAVRETFALPPRTATHWIKLARERGHLPDQYQASRGERHGEHQAEA